MNLRMSAAPLLLLLWTAATSSALTLQPLHLLAKREPCTVLSSTPVYLKSEIPLYEFRQPGDHEPLESLLSFQPDQPIPREFRLLGGDVDGCAYSLYEDGSATGRVVKMVSGDATALSEEERMEVRVLSALYRGEVQVANLELSGQRRVGIFMPLVPGKILTDSLTWDERIGPRPKGLSSSSGNWKEGCIAALKDLKLHEMVADEIMLKASEVGFLHCDAHRDNVLFEDSEYDPSTSSTWTAVHLIDWARSVDVHHVEWAFSKEADKDHERSFAPVRCLEAEAVEGRTAEEDVEGAGAGLRLGPYSSQRQEVLRSVRRWLPVEVSNESGDALCA